MQRHARDRLGGALELGQGEDLAHQFEQNRAVFQLAAQAPDRGCQDPPVITPGRGAERGQVGGYVHAPVAPALRHQAGAVEQLVAFERQFVTPAAVMGAVGRAKNQRDPLAPLDRIARPIPQARQDCLGQDRRHSLAPVFPGKPVGPGTPSRLRRRAVRRDQRQIADRDRVRIARIASRRPARSPNV